MYILLSSFTNQQVTFVAGLCMLDLPMLEDPDELYSDYRMATAINDFMTALPTREVVLVIDYTVGLFLIF
jgi:hypothetical protein